MQRGQSRWALPAVVARRRHRADEVLAQHPDAPQPDERQPDGQQMYGRAPGTGSQWRRVPPISPVIGSRPVLTGSPLLDLPKVSGTRSLITRESNDAGFTIARPAGRVTGVVVPAETTDDPPLQRAPEFAMPLTEQPDRPAPVRLRPTVPATAADRPTLIKATQEFVGDPQADETPYASSAWLRMLQAYRLPVGGAEPADPPVPGLAQTVKPDGGTVLSWSSSAPEPPRYRNGPLTAESERGSEPGRPESGRQPTPPAGDAGRASPKAVDSA